MNMDFILVPLELCFIKQIHIYVVKETIQLITVQYFNHLKYHHQWRLSREIKTVGEILLFDNFDIFIEL